MERDVEATAFLSRRGSTHCISRFDCWQLLLIFCWK